MVVVVFGGGAFEAFVRGGVVPGVLVGIDEFAAIVVGVTPVVASLGSGLVPAAEAVVGVDTGGDGTPSRSGTD